jgi:hypothetical protein
MLAFGKRSSTSRSLPIKLRTRSRKDKTLRLKNPEQQGFTPERRFLTITCSLNQLLFTSNLPTGFTVQRLSGDRNLKAWVLQGEGRNSLFPPPTKKYIGGGRNLRYFTEQYYAVKIGNL